MGEPTTPPELLLTSLDANVQACVARTCRGLAREAAGDVVWCTQFLRRFGLDFWGEAAGRHPYHSVPPEEPNEWRDLSVDDVFTTFSARLASEAPPSAHAAAGGRDGDHEDHDMARALCEFVQRHATHQGYGGWKQAYLRMHKMVRTLTKQSDEGLLVAGLPAFDALSTIASSIRDENLVVSKLGASVEEDLVSPCGECRVIRLAGNRFVWANGQTATVPHDTTICVIRKPRNWFKGPRELFRGFGLTHGSIKLIYVVDGSKVERSDAYQDRAYRELHGVLGEGKGRFFPTMPILMCLLNTEPANELPIMERLRIPRYVEPHHHCPFYNGAVFFGVVSFALPDKHVDRPTRAAALFGSDDDAVDWEAEADRQSKVADGLAWLLATSTRIARDPPLLLCALRGDTNPFSTFLQPQPPTPTPTPAPAPEPAPALANVSQP